MDVYDPIHGNIFIDPLAKAIVDTPEFQRLRNIKQLGCCYYVFPGACHNRFEHSLGVYHLTKEYIQILNTDNQFTAEEIRCLTIAALIHDIGHGPYSHLFDELLPKENHHEYRSIQLLKHMNTTYSLHLTDEDMKMIQDMIDPQDPPKEKPYLYQIVSNPNGVDVDRFDYLIRDIRAIGLNYGIEYKRIMKHSVIVDGTIQYSEKVQVNIQEFFRTRAIMYKEVYNHHTVRALEYMIQTFLELTNDYFQIKQSILKQDWSKFLTFTDSLVELSPFLPGIPEKATKLMKQIKERRLYQRKIELISPFKLCDTLQKDNFIIDVVYIQCSGKQKCKYITKKESFNYLKDTTESYYITSVYSKLDKLDREGEVWIELLKDKVIQGPQKSLPVHSHQGHLGPQSV